MSNGIVLPRHRKLLDKAKEESSNFSPCPFCGNVKVTVNTKAKSYFIKKEAERAKKDTSNYTCRCTRCGAKGPLKHSWIEAAEAWNLRQPIVSKALSPNSEGRVTSC